MNLKTALLFLLSLAGTSLLQAYGPLYLVKLASTRNFELIADATTINRLSLYPLSEMGAKMNQGTKGRKVIAADYDVGFAQIKTDNPAVAAQDIINQIGQQTGLMLRKHLNSSLAAIAPTTLVQAFSETAVINLMLTPKGSNVYLVTCSYVLFERPEGSVDGTPAAIAQMQETLRLISADSAATSLPATTNLQEIKPGDYYRSPMGCMLPDADGEFFPAVVLMLKKGSDYAVGFYRNEDNKLTLMDQSVALSGTASPFVTNLPADPSLPAGTPLRVDQTRMALRANKVGGTGGYYISLENGRVVKREF